MSEDADALRAYYDVTDTSAELEDAVFSDTVTSEPMVGITIRLPAAALDSARRLARERGLKVTALIREWVEERVGERALEDRVVPVADLHRLIARAARDRAAG